MATVMASEEVRRSWGTTLDRVFQGEQLVVERFGRPLAVLVSVAQWDGLMERLTDLEDRRRNELAAGRPLTDQQWSLVKQARVTLAAGGPTVSSAELNAKLKERYPHAADKI
jgi:prevent-host-death family protein